MLGGSVGRCGRGLEFSINACWANAWLSGVMAASLGHPARMAGNGFCRRSRPPASAAKRSRGIAGNGAFWDHYPCVAAVERAVHSTLTLPAVSQASLNCSLNSSNSSHSHTVRCSSLAFCLPLEPFVSPHLMLALSLDTPCR